MWICKRLFCSRQAFDRQYSASKVQVFKSRLTSIQEATIRTGKARSHALIIFQVYCVYWRKSLWYRGTSVDFLKYQQQPRQPSRRQAQLKREVPRRLPQSRARDTSHEASGVGNSRPRIAAFEQKTKATDTRGLAPYKTDGWLRVRNFDYIILHACFPYANFNFSSAINNNVDETAAVRTSSSSFLELNPVSQRIMFAFGLDARVINQNFEQKTSSCASGGG